MAVKKASLKKTSLIAKANKNMFVWVAIVSVVLGITVVGSIILVQRILHMNRVISSLQTTSSNIDANIKSVQTLSDNIRVLSTNQDLASSKAKASDETLQVILDALPSEANSLALGASFQDVLLAGNSGVSIDSITVSPVVGIESTSSGAATQSSSNLNTPSIAFSFAVKGTLSQLLSVLNNLERSIRVIDTQKVTISKTSDQLTLTVSGVAYYQPAVDITLTNKVIK